MTQIIVQNALCQKIPRKSLERPEGIDFEARLISTIQGGLFIVIH